MKQITSLSLMVLFSACTILSCSKEENHENKEQASLVQKDLGRTG